MRLPCPNRTIPLFFAGVLLALVTPCLAGALEYGKPMYRLYNPYTGEHFYTASYDEALSVNEAGWSYEGIGWVAPSSGDPVYRLYNPYAGDHHYTMSAEERDHLVTVGWRYEGVGWSSDGNVKLHRQYNPYARVGTHNYTYSTEERDHLVSLGWHDEGVAWYGIRTQATSDIDDFESSSYINGPYGWGGYIEGYNGSDSDLIVPTAVRNGSFLERVYSVILDEDDLQTVKTIMFETDNNEIKEIGFSTSHAVELNVSGLVMLQEVTIEAPLINSTLDLSVTDDLTEVTLSGCGVSTIVLGNQPQLNNITIEGSNISSLDLSGCPNLNSVTLVDCPKLSSIDISGLTKMRGFTAERTPLTSIDVSRCTSLIWLDLIETDIESLDVSQSTELAVITVQNEGAGEGIKEIIYNDCPSGGYLTVTSSRIETLALGNCGVESISITNSGNTLKDIDVSGCPRLLQFVVEGNAFSDECRERIEQHPNWSLYWRY